MTVMIPENCRWFDGVDFQFGEGRVPFDELGPCHQYLLQVYTDVLCERLHMCRRDVRTVEDVLKAGRERAKLEVIGFGGHHPLTDATYDEAEDLFRQWLAGDDIRSLLQDVFATEIDGVAVVREMMSA